MIYREGNGPRPWRCRLRLRGHQTQKSFRTKAEAEEYEREERANYAREKAGLRVLIPPVPWDELCDIFLANYTSADGGKWFASMLTPSRERFGTVRCDLLRAEEIGRWLHALDKSPKTKLHYLTAMRQVCNAAVEWGYLLRSPVRPGAVRAPAGATIPNEVFPFQSWAEVEKVAAAAGHYGPYIRFRCATGLRADEANNLRREDIDRENRVMHVAGTKNENARRAVQLSKQALAALDDGVSRIDTRYVWTTPSGKRIDNNNFRAHIWKPALQAAGLADRPPRQTRHTYATLALAAGCTLEWIAEQMGHSSIEITTKYYARFVKRVDDRMLSLLDQMGDEDADFSLTNPPQPQ